VYDGDALVAEFNASGVLLRRDIHGPGVDDPLIWMEGATTALSTRRFLLRNWQGSIVGHVLAYGGHNPKINTYDAFGVPGSANSGRFQYTGQIFLPEVGRSSAPLIASRGAASPLQGPPL
jgi:hypothetical protein